VDDFDFFFESKSDETPVFFLVDVVNRFSL
jgi:hypothetical protein